MTLGELPVWFVRTLATVFGLVWGSFVNVVIYRVPRGLSVVRPASACPSCGAPIRAYDNVPVVSYVVLRGRTRCCKTALSPRYPIVELIGAALSLAVVELLRRRLSADTGLLRAAAVYVAEFAMALALAAAAFIDAEHMFLPDEITLGGTLLGVGTASLRDSGYVDALEGAALGFLLVYVPFIVVYKRLRGVPGMGLGDAKLTMLAGAWFGLRGALFVLLAGAVQGTLAALVIWLVHGKIEEPEAVRADRKALETAARGGDDEAQQLLEQDPLGAPPGQGLAKARLPFGPFLIIGWLEYLLLGDSIARAAGLWLRG